MSKPTPTRLKLSDDLIRVVSKRPQVGTFIRKVYDLILETGINGEGYSIALDSGAGGADLVIRLGIGEIPPPDPPTSE